MYTAVQCCTQGTRSPVHSRHVCPVMVWLLLLLIQLSAAWSTAQIHPAQDWLDAQGNRIDAHSGRVLWDPRSNRYYWHGMSTIGKSASEFHIVSCYSSTNLLSWDFAGVALNTTHYVSRPKVLLHPDGRYVLPHDPSFAGCIVLLRAHT